VGASHYGVRMGDGLSVQRRSKALRATGAIVVLAALVGIGSWYLTHPQPLPISERRIDASTPAGSPVFIGVFDVPADFDRTIDVSGVRVYANATTDVAITPRLCRGGSIGATREPLPFCQEILGTEDVRVGPGDQIILEVASQEAGAVVIEPIQVAFSDGLQRGIQTAGSRALVTFLSR
jgi:hypothetical protein